MTMWWKWVLWALISISWFGMFWLFNNADWLFPKIKRSWLKRNRPHELDPDYVEALEKMNRDFPGSHT